MSPIRVALVGLSAVDPSSPTHGTWGIIAHLRPLLASPHYELVAVCNSSVASAEKSIAHHNLPKSVKAYGSTADLAKDPGVDLAAVSINVQMHHEATKPLLQAGKDVFVEWPLGRNVAEAEELTQLVKDKGVRSMVGLQLVDDPLIGKIKEILDSGKIGKVLSSNLIGCSSVMPATTWVKGGEYLFDMEAGGNQFTIFFGHVLGAFMHLLGDFDTVSSVLKTQYPTVSLMDPETQEVVDPAYPRATPDHVFVQGQLGSGAVATMSLRTAPKPVDGLSLRWLITGTEGEMEVTMPEDMFQMGNPGRAIRLRVGKDDVQDVSFEDPQEPEHVKAVKYPGTNTARMYERYAVGGSGVVDFETSLKTHKLLARIHEASGFQ